MQSKFVALKYSELWLRIWEMQNTFYGVIDLYRKAMGNDFYLNFTGPNKSFWVPQVGSELNGLGVLVAPIKNWHVLRKSLKVPDSVFFEEHNFWIPRIPKSERSDSDKNKGFLTSGENPHMSKLVCRAPIASFPYFVCQWAISGKSVFFIKSGISNELGTVDVNLSGDDVINLLGKAWILKLDEPVEYVTAEKKALLRELVVVVQGNGKIQVVCCGVVGDVISIDCVHELEKHVEAFNSFDKPSSGARQKNLKKLAKLNSLYNDRLGSIMNSLGIAQLNLIFSLKDNYLESSGPNRQANPVLYAVRAIVINFIMAMKRHLLDGMEINFERFLAAESDLLKRRGDSSSLHDKKEEKEVVDPILGIFDIPLGNVIFLEEDMKPAKRGHNTSGIRIKIGNSPTSHWRKPHWRRPPGMGHDKSAKPTVEVRGEGPDGLIQVRGIGDRTARPVRSPLRQRKQD